MNKVSKLTKQKVIIRTQYDPEYCQLLIQHCGEGYSLESFAGANNISPDKIEEWAMLYPDFKDAAKIALTKMMYFWECQLLAGMKIGDKSHIDCSKLMLLGLKDLTANKIRNALYDNYKEDNNDKATPVVSDLAKELEANLNKKMGQGIKCSL